ncbi:hypothetical protein C3Y08_22640 [Burkholderia gladioli]|nr:hypothetical protein C3Y08_22640 [Burkholderia gladioli]
MPFDYSIMRFLHDRAIAGQSARSARERKQSPCLFSGAREWRQRAGRRHPKLQKISRKPCWARSANGCTGRDARRVPMIERAN